ncbi:glutamate--tRNA ligase [Candidatus Sumerlaeota bacterium]|nr:glutamate--tRNA ligase [Candidatus Sumerlaeota bacterium]
MTEKPVVRTRVAPSPTGDPHIGTACQALFDYVFAKSRGGQFVLRIEDTDRARSTPESEAKIFEALRWLGIPWDEGPDVGGPYGPYRQSERTEIYREHCRTLLDKGHAYRCFCAPERLETVRNKKRGPDERPGYDGHCRNLGEEEIRRRLDAGVPFVVRMRVPDEGECVFKDMLRNEVRIPWHNVDEQVLMKSDNFPTYHLANVVDDRLMRITHVIRGEEWISSTPKHLLLYEYFGWAPPEFCHLPLLRNPDKSKLSKRKNPTSILYYREAGFLPEAIVNYLGQMAYTLADGREMFSLADMVETFDPRRIGLGGPVFDIAKLTWLNGRYLRETMDAETLLARLREWKLSDDVWARILPLAQPRIEKLSDLVPLTAFFFADRPQYAAEALISKKLDGDATARLLRIALWEMEKVRDWNKETVQACVARIAEKEDLKLRDAVGPFFVALTGSPSSTPLFDTMAILGSDMTRRRLQYALDALAEAGHALSSKKTKEIEKDYRERYEATS